MKTFVAMLAGLIAVSASSRPVSAEPLTLAGRLGYPSDARLLIVNGDDAGMCHAANVGTAAALDSGLMTSATVMVPCPWFLEIADYARRNPAKNLGVHLVHTSEWKWYRWGPIAPREAVPGLADSEGYLWRSVEEVYAHSSPAEALIEGRAQIKRALAAGIDVTHLDSHMGTLQYDARYMETYLQLAVEFDLPVRMASQSLLIKFSQPELRDRFAARGIVFPDFLIHEELKDESKDVQGFWMRMVRELKPGVTEFYVHAAKPTEELQAITGTWKTRGAEYELLSSDADFRRLIESERVTLIGYRPLRDLQRQSRKSTGE